MSAPQPQQNLVVIQVALFEQRSGSAPLEHGNVKCAIAAQPADPNPRYKIVCYAEGSVACVATIGGSNDNSIQFEMQTSDYGSFKDDNGKVWSVMFLRSIDVEPFLSHLAVAFFGASGSPSHSATVADYAPTGTKSSSIAPSHSGKKVELGRRVKTRYTAFSIRRAASALEVPKIDSLIETNGDAPFMCDPVQSPFGIPPDGKGFEAFLAGGSEGCWRAVVVPQSMPRSCNSPMLNIHTLVFIIQFTKVMPAGDGDASSFVGAGGALVVAGGGNGGGGVPDVTSGGGGHGSALVVHSSSSGGGGNEVVPSGVFGGGNSGSSPIMGTHTQGSGIGAGVPAEHMLFVQKLAGQINTAVSTLKDMQDRVDSMSQEWKQDQNRPKPSTLSAQALEQNVKSLCLEHDRLRDELLRREELIAALDDRNRTLQKTVDKAAMQAQQLLDEKKNAASKSSDTRLDSDRTSMKLQESILRARSERDDLARHLQTVKRLLDASDMELRDAKGKKEVMQVQLTALGGKLDASEENLAEERSRRKAFESKVGALQDEIRNATAEHHLKTAQVEDWRRKADAERVHYMQMMEDERSRRSVESAQLRSEIVDELQQRDRKFESDRARTQQEHFSRGHDEGKEVGRKTARADYEVRMNDLQLEAQRAKTELDAYKEQLREAQDSAQANHRRLDAAITALKSQVEDGTRSRAQLEFQVQRAKAQVKSAEDSLYLGVSSLAHRLIMPVEPANIIAQLENLRAGKVMDLSFQETTFAAATEAAKARRQAVVSETMLSLHEEGLSAIYNAAVSTMEALHSDVRATVERLWAKRQADQRYEVEDGERTARAEFTGDEDAEFKAIEAYAATQREQRATVEAEFDSLHAAIVQEEAEGMAAIEAIVFEQQVAAQKVVIEEEAEARAEIEERGEPAEFQANIVDEAAADRRHIDAVETFRKAQQAERDECELSEAAPRSEVEAEEKTDFADLLDDFESSKPKPPKPPTPEPEPEPEPQPTTTVVAAPNKSHHDTSSDDDVPAKQPAPAAKKAPVRTAASADSSDDDGAGARPVKAPPVVAPAASKAPAPAKQQQQQSVAAASGTSGEKEGVSKEGFTLPVSTGSPKTGLFGGSSDEDSDADGPKPAPKPVAKPVAPKVASPASKRPALFGSDSDDSDGGGARAPAPAPKKTTPAAPVGGKKALPKKSALFGSDSD